MTSIISARVTQQINYSDYDNPAFRSTRWGPSARIERALVNSLFTFLPKSELAVQEDLSARAKPKVVRQGKLMTYLEHFSTTNYDVQIGSIMGSVVRTFKVTSYLSEEPIAGKKLRVILFDFHNNTEGPNNSPWSPTTLEELGQSPISVLKAFQGLPMRIDSFVTQRLGNIVFLAKELDRLPSTLIIEGNLTAVKKIADSSSLLYRAAKLFGRKDPDPENNLVSFLEKSQEMRNVVLIELRKNFDIPRELTNRIANSRNRVFRIAFQSDSPLVTPRSLDVLKGDAPRFVVKNTMTFEWDTNGTMASNLAKNVFFKGNEEVHTCFCVGNREFALDLISGFVQEGKKIQE